MIGTWPATKHDSSFRSCQSPTELETCVYDWFEKAHNSHRRLPCNPWADLIECATADDCCTQLPLALCGVTVFSEKVACKMRPIVKSHHLVFVTCRVTKQDSLRIKQPGIDGNLVTRLTHNGCPVDARNNVDVLDTKLAQRKPQGTDLDD